MLFILRCFCSKKSRGGCDIRIFFLLNLCISFLLWLFRDKKKAILVNICATFHARWNFWQMFSLVLRWSGGLVTWCGVGHCAWLPRCMPCHVMLFGVVVICCDVIGCIAVISPNALINCLLLSPTIGWKVMSLWWQWLWGHILWWKVWWYGGPKNCSVLRQYFFEV